MLQNSKIVTTEGATFQKLGKPEKPILRAHVASE